MPVPVLHVLVEGGELVETDDPDDHHVESLIINLFTRAGDVNTPVSRKLPVRERPPPVLIGSPSTPAPPPSSDDEGHTVTSSSSRQTRSTRATGRCAPQATTPSQPKKRKVWGVNRYMRRV